MVPTPRSARSAANVRNPPVVRSRRVAAWLALLLGLVVVEPAAAQQPSLSDPVDEAKALIASGHPDEARARLLDLAKTRPRDNDVDFLLGLLAIEGGDYGGAIRRFRAILVREPGATRVRLELARAFYLAKDYENAFRQFQFARAGNPPEGVVRTIERFLAAIRQEKSWSYNLSIALAPDTNINNATSAREAVLFGLPFELAGDARRTSGVGIALGAAGEIAPRVSERTRLRFGASLQRREYDGKHFDDMTLALHAGPRLVLSKWDLGLLGTGFRRWYGAKRFNEGVGARLEATHYLDSRTALSFGVSAQEVRYPHSSPQTGPTFAVFGGAVRALTPASSVTVRVGLGRQASRGASFANWSGQVGVGYYRDLPGGFSIYLEPSFSYARYAAADPLFGERRRDFGQEIQLSILNRRIVLTRFTPRISYTFARRNSSIDLYDFTQNRVEVGLTSQF